MNRFDSVSFTDSFFSVWPTTHKIATIVPVTVFYGISSGAFVALIGSPVVQMGGHDSVGERTGLLFTFTALGALSGPPISGAIRSNSGNWESVGYYAGKILSLNELEWERLIEFLSFNRFDDHISRDSHVDHQNSHSEASFPWSYLEV